MKRSVEAVHGFEADGPRVYSDLFDWPKHFFDRIVGLDGDFSSHDVRKTLRRRKVVLTTSFSGMGTAEIALNLISGFLVQQGICKRDQFQLYCAVDSDTKCQRILCHGDNNSGAKHVFADVCSVVSADVVSQLKARLKELRQEAERHPDRREEYETKFHQFAKKLLSGATFDKQAYCLKCKQFCSRFWNAGMIVDGNPSDYLWIECGGSPCVPFVRGG